MKKFLALFLVLALLLSTCSSVLAMNFTGELGNEATFETLEEAHISAPIVAKTIAENSNKNFIGHPALDNYPAGTTFVYRSANQYAGRAAARLNTNLFVYTSEKFADKDAAYAYLQNAGLIDIIDECTGSIVLVTPIGASFGTADAAAYYALQTAMLSLKVTMTMPDNSRKYMAEAEYFGGFAYLYFIGIDGGATFFNNYIAPEIDFVGRLAGALLIGGTMEEVRKPSIFVPIYLVNAKADVIAKYEKINGVDAMRRNGDVITGYNQAWPLRKVIKTNVEEIDLPTLIRTAYDDLFVKAMRIPVMTQAVYSAGSPYSGYSLDEAPYSLCDRCYIKDGMTAEGIVFIAHRGEDTFSDIVTTEPYFNFISQETHEPGEYLDTWYEYLPIEVLDGTAPDGTIPLIVGNHGNDDDPRVFAEEFGLVELAGQERVAVVAPDHQNIAETRGPALTALVEYMLATYPALDASRVYLTGYSMGGIATYNISHYNPSLFAAIAPSAGTPTDCPEELLSNFDGVELPVCFSLPSYDTSYRLEYPTGPINANMMRMVEFWAGVNGIDQSEFDLEKYPTVGFAGDEFVMEIVNDEYEMDTWYLNNEAGEPRIAFIYLKGMIHALYPEYSQMIWNFVKHYSRNLETGEIIYTPYAK